MPDKSAAGPRLTKLGRYEVLNELGKGAMGIVYLAKDPVIGRMVAIKTIRTSSFGDDDSESREFRERFIREAQTAGILSHPNIVTIHDIGEDPDTQISFIAMEYIEGRNLKSLLAEKTKFTYEQIGDIIAQVAEAIDYAHRKGIIHRDIKPANVIITTDNKVKIMDFGIAKIASSNLTTTGQFLGTPNYMSPEQVSGAAVDGRSDIFSLGVVLYELLTSRKPFQGENLTAISYKIVHEEFTPPAELAPDVPADFNAIVSRAMAKDPWNRYQRGKDFALALHQLRARLEEQRTFRDLGSMVSAAENMPTLRLENVDKLAAEAQAGHPKAAPQEIDHSDLTEDSGAGFSPFAAPPRPTPGEPSGRPQQGSPRPAEARTMAIPIVTGDLPPPPAEEAADRPTAPSESAASPSATRPPRMTPPRASAPPAAPPAASVAAPPAGGFPPTQPLAPAAQAARRPAWITRLDAMRERLSSGEWKKLLRAEVNRPWFWGLTAAAGFFLLVILGAGFLRVQLVSRPSGSADPEVAREVAERKQALADGKKLFAEGKYTQSLALLRQVLARSPGNQEARRFAQMAESALAGRAEEARKSAEADKSLEAARSAFASNQYDEAVRRADEALALDGGKVEAQKIKEDAQSKLAESKAVEARAATAQARKKKEERKAQVAARRQPTAAPQGRAENPTAAPANAAAAAGPATLRLQFQSPISEGNVMVYVNDQKALQKPFDFSRKAGLFKRVDGTGTVEEVISVRPGPVSVKIWLSGKGLTAAAYTATSGQLAGGETRVLKVDYAGGQLSARIQ